MVKRGSNFIKQSRPRLTICETPLVQKHVAYVVADVSWKVQSRALACHVSCVRVTVCTAKTIIKREYDMGWMHINGLIPCNVQDESHIKSFIIIMPRLNNLCAFAIDE